MNPNVNYDRINQTLYNLAFKSFLKNEVPIAAVVIDKHNKIIGKGRNTRNKSHNIIGHAEISALQQAIKKKKTWNLSNATIISTVEPCMMCLGAIQQSKIKNIVYFLDQPNLGFINSNHTFDLSKMNVNKISLSQEKNHYKRLMKNFFVHVRNSKTKQNKDFLFKFLFVRMWKWKKNTKKG